MDRGMGEVKQMWKPTVKECSHGQGKGGGQPKMETYGQGGRRDQNAKCAKNVRTYFMDDPLTNLTAKWTEYENMNVTVNLQTVNTISRCQP